MKNQRSAANFLKQVFLHVLIWMVSAGLHDTSFADTPPEDLQSIGGKWFIQKAQENAKPVYFFRDGERYVDLFSYHTKDSNKDGIENIRLSHDKDFLIMESQGYPNHPTAIFPNNSNPNTIRLQKFVFRLPLEPKLATQITRLPMGPIGTALNGVVFFNPFEAGGMNAVEGYSEVWLDSCCGHPAPDGIYHYHKYPSCVKSPFSDNGKQHSPVIGFAFDGFPVYGPYEGPGLMAKDLQGTQALDVCNGHRDDERGYHYHVTPGRFPYIIGGYSGVVERSNSRGLGRAGTGPIENNAQPGSRMQPVITAVRPGTGSRGKSHELQLELTPSNAQRGSVVPAQAPSWAQIGPYEARKISRTGNIVTVEVEIPEDATLGVLLDCHIEFDPDGRRPPIVFKKNDVFRVTD